MREVDKLGEAAEVLQFRDKAHKFVLALCCGA